jgi:hypothetical protein
VVDWIGHGKSLTVGVFVGVFIILVHGFIYSIHALSDTVSQSTPRIVERWYTSKNMNAFPSSAPGATARKLAISSFEGCMAGRMRYLIETSKWFRRRVKRSLSFGLGHLCLG